MKISCVNGVGTFVVIVALSHPNLFAFIFFSQAAQLYQENKREYEKRVRAIVEQSWIAGEGES